MTDHEIAPGDRSGGATTSHTALIPSFIDVLDNVGRDATLDDYEQAVVEDNLLGTSTTESRTRMFRAMRELYLLRPDTYLFRAIRDLWTDDPRGQPLLAGLLALARDSVFRAGSSVITQTDPGDTVVSADFGRAVADVFPDAYSESTLGKIGRNHYASWEQSGHLEPASGNEKVRRRPVCTPATTAYALLLGHLEGVRGPALFETTWAQVLDHPRSFLIEQATIASQRSLVDFRNSGGVIEVGFSELLRPMEGHLL